MYACHDCMFPHSLTTSTSTALLQSSQYYLASTEIAILSVLFYFDDILFRSRSDFGHSGWKIFRLTVERVLVRLKDVIQRYTVSNWIVLIADCCLCELILC